MVIFGGTLLLSPSDIHVFGYRTLQGYLAHEEHPPSWDHYRSLGIDRATVGSEMGAVSCRKGNPILWQWSVHFSRCTRGLSRDARQCTPNLET